MTNYIFLQDEEIEIEKYINYIKSNEYGAISSFLGITRDVCDGKKVRLLSYEAYDQMAYKEIENICINIRKIYPNLGNVVIVHRLGDVLVGEISILIAAAAPHRLDCLKATEELINYIKQSAPIWKKEIYYDNESDWKCNNECFWT